MTRSFVHQDPDFGELIRIVAREVGIGAALVEKDYWVTHCMWALHRTGLEIWFKGGTSLSKGFGLIHRFSEDLDLKIMPGSVSLPEVTNWKSSKKGRVAQRHAYYDALADAMAIPDVRVERDATRIDERARGADYLGHYPSPRLGELPEAMSPFVRFEVGRARVVPCVERPLTSFVHDYIEREGLLGDDDDNRPRSVRCVHPLVTLLEKLDAASKRFGRGYASDTFVRHYEDAAQILRAVNDLPELDRSSLELAQEMVASKDIPALPNADDPAWLLEDEGRRGELEAAYQRIDPMFWGPRVALDEARVEIRDWIGRLVR